MYGDYGSPTPHSSSITQRRTPFNSNGNTASSYGNAPSYGANTIKRNNFNKRRAADGFWTSNAAVSTLRAVLFIVLALTYIVCNRRVAWVKTQLSNLHTDDGSELRKVRDTIRNHRSEEVDLSNQFDSVRKNRDKTRKNLERARLDLDKSKVVLEETKKTGIAPAGVDKDVTAGMTIEEREGYERRMQAMTGVLDGLQGRIQDISFHDVIEKFGNGPYVVEFELDFPENTPDGNSDAKFFRVEMAPLSDMPHSVDLFLEMVDHKLWDNCAFILNSRHVLQAAPVDVDESTETIKMSRRRFQFKDARLETVAFQEYSDNFPHVKYTLGFAGRPGGPDFYINMIDNSRDHGPGGQTHHALQEDADPCFAKVVDGFDTIERIATVPGLDGGKSDARGRVTIKTARLVKNK